MHGKIDEDWAEFNGMEALIRNAFDVNTYGWDGTGLTSSDANSSLARSPGTTLAYGLASTVHIDWTSNTFAGVVPAPDDSLSLYFG
jgi:hypothetical protein